jgi:ADP-heptose:LPS heptosyltransferase
VSEARVNCSLIFHAGALGDFVLIWALLRTLAAADRRPLVIAAESHTRLAHRCLNIPGLSSERREVTELWRDPTSAALLSAWAHLLDARTSNLVFSFVADEHSKAGRLWLDNAGRAFPRAEVIAVGAPGSTTRTAAWARFDVDRRGRAPARPRVDGPIVLHIGAGSREKCWPFEYWRALAKQLRGQGHPVTLIAGEVERERMSDTDRVAFLALGGRVLADLDALADTLLSARAFVGADTGPTHLSAQLGAPTLAVFGPTDPRVWSPVGPAVRVLAPDSPRDTAWANPDTVRLGLNRLLRDVAGSSPSN